MSTATDYARPRRINWDNVLTGACGLCALLVVGAAETLSDRLYRLAVMVWGWM